VLLQRVLCDRHTAAHTKVEKTVVITKKAMWKSNLNSVKYVPMIFVNFIIIAIIVFDKKKKKKEKECLLS